MKPPQQIITGPITTRNVRVADEIHFSGGLRGVRTDGGWSVGPILRNGSAKWVGPFPDEQLAPLARELGLEMLGADEVVIDEAPLETRMWRPFGVDQAQPASKWGAIAFNARNKGDTTYANLARNLAICLHSSDVRLRDASDQYNLQLVAAIKRKAQPNLAFSNLALTNLHLAFHSLLSEMASARDYFASVVGRHIGAPEKVDCLTRLIAWTNASTRSHLRDTPLVAPLIQATNSEAEGRWLHRLGEYRNTFIHRTPIGASSASGAVRIGELPTGYGSVYTLRMDIPAADNPEEQVEALVEFLELYRKLLRLLWEMADLARYPTTPPTIYGSE